MGTNRTDPGSHTKGSRQPFLFAYWAIAVYGLIQILLIVSSTPDDWTQIVTDMGSLGILILLAISGVWCVEIFTTPIAECTEQDKDSDFYRLKQQWMAFAYGFMVFSVVVAVAPFTDQKGHTPGDPGYEEWVTNIRNAPISLFPGCIEGTTPGGTTSFAELTCRAIAPARTVGETAEASGAAPVSSATWLVNIGGQVRECLNGTKHLCVSGGLVVPLHLIVLSLMGGAISLTRRVPEYQKQGAEGYVGTTRAPFLPPRLLREYLIYQIIQFISAPLIAIVAYYLIEPASTSVSVAIAFAAGFASESVLLLIRAAVEKVAPAPRKGVLRGSVVGVVRNPDETPAKGARVRILDAPGDGVDTDANGLFVLNDVPTGERTVQAQCKDEPKTYALAAVMVTPRKVTAPVELRLPKPCPPQPDAEPPAT